MAEFSRHLTVANELGLEQIASPSATTAPMVYLTVVQTMFPVGPELDDLRVQPKPRPPRRAWDVATLEFAVQLCDTRQKAGA